MSNSGRPVSAPAICFQRVPNNSWFVQQEEISIRFEFYLGEELIDDDKKLTNRKVITEELNSIEELYIKANRHGGFDVSIKLRTYFLVRSGAKYNYEASFQSFADQCLKPFLTNVKGEEKTIIDYSCFAAPDEDGLLKMIKILVERGFIPKSCHEDIDQTLKSTPNIKNDIIPAIGLISSVEQCYDDYSSMLHRKETRRNSESSIYVSLKDRFKVLYKNIMYADLLNKVITKAIKDNTIYFFVYRKEKEFSCENICKFAINTAYKFKNKIIMNLMIGYAARAHRAKKPVDPSFDIQKDIFAYACNLLSGQESMLHAFMSVLKRETLDNYASEFPQIAVYMASKNISTPTSTPTSSPQLTPTSSPHPSRMFSSNYSPSTSSTNSIASTSADVSTPPALQRTVSCPSVIDTFTLAPSP